MPTFWHPDTCSEDAGCIFQIEGGTLVGIARTCTGHAAQFGRAVALSREPPQATRAGDQPVFDAVRTQNARGERQQPAAARIDHG